MSSTKQDPILGTILIASWASSLLYTTIATQVWRYFKRFGKDPLWIKLLVAFAFTIDTVSLTADFINVYLSTVSNWGNEAYLTNEGWPYSVYLFCTAVVAFLTQFYLVHRYFKLTTDYIISGLLMCTVLATCGATFATAIMLTLKPRFDQRDLLAVPFTTWVATTAASDIAIAAALIRQLRSVQKQTHFDQTRNVLQRLILSSVKTGVASSVLAIGALISYLVTPNTNTVSLFLMVLGRVYVLTLVVNLNSRGGLRSESSGGRGKNADSESGGNNGRSDNVVMSGIQVHRTIHVFEDEFMGKDDIETPATSERPDLDDESSKGELDNKATAW